MQMERKFTKTKFNSKRVKYIPASELTAIYSANVKLVETQCSAEFISDLTVPHRHLSTRKLSSFSQCYWVWT